MAQKSTDRLRCVAFVPSLRRKTFMVGNLQMSTEANDNSAGWWVDSQTDSVWIAMLWEMEVENSNEWHQKEGSMNWHVCPWFRAWMIHDWEESAILSCCSRDGTLRCSFWTGCSWTKPKRLEDEWMALHDRRRREKIRKWELCCWLTMDRKARNLVPSAKLLKDLTEKITYQAAAVGRN